MRRLSSRLPSIKFVRRFSVGDAPPEKQLLPEDIEWLRQESLKIMESKQVTLSSDEVESFLRPKKAISYVEEWKNMMTPRLINREILADRFMKLCCERINNLELMNTFRIGRDFNSQCYFLTLHVWFLHKRVELLDNQKEAKKLDFSIFESLWRLITNWMMIKNVASFRFSRELRNVQEYMLGMCVALDKSLEEPDILPGRISYTVWANLYSGKIRREAPYVNELTRYIMRQTSLLLQLEEENFLRCEFTWANFQSELRPEIVDRSDRLGLSLVFGNTSKAAELLEKLQKDEIKLEKMNEN